MSNLSRTYPFSPRSHRICVTSDTSELKKIRDFIEQTARKLGFGEQATYNIALAVDEACANIIRHSYRHDTSREFCLEIFAEEGSITINIIDNGATFDPLSLAPPNMKEYFNKFMKGGLGVPIIRRFIDDIRYQSADSEHPYNVLTLVKRIS